MEAAAGVLGDSRDGVWLVELAALADPALVPEAIASALGVRESGPVPLIDTLSAYLRARRLLLVLDNFEHLLPAALQLSRLLASCPALKVLVTSRVALRVRAEQEVPVPPLEVPKTALAYSAQAVLRAPAAQLFEQRTRALRPDSAS